MLKMCDNPPIISPGVETVSDLSGRWWVAHTKSRFEKAFAWDLLGRRIGYFLPMVERVRFVGRRKRRVLMPLFPSYVFFCGTSEDRYEALATDRLCKAIEVVDQRRFVAELLPIEKALACGAELELHPMPAVGRRCRIRAGPFKDFEGIVIRHKKKARLVLQISILGQGALLDIETDLLEPID